MCVICLHQIVSLAVTANTNQSQNYILVNIKAVSMCQVNDHWTFKTAIMSHHTKTTTKISECRMNILNVLVFISFYFFLFHFIFIDLLFIYFITMYKYYFIFCYPLYICICCMIDVKYTSIIQHLLTYEWLGH